MKNPFYQKVAWLCFGLLLFGIQGVFAQQNVSGTITDVDGEPLIGASILVKGKGTGTVTDFDGTYQLNVSSADTLVFSYTGFAPQEVAVGNQTVIDITLDADAALLDEVVVVGYGTMRKSDVTGSIVSMRDEALTDVKSGNVFESLQGRVAGVEITRDNGRAGADLDLLIRGKRSLRASNGPLVLVDGVPYGDNIAIAPEDIESIEILKDASSTAVYGSRGANGVILITTKRGTAERSRITFNTYLGVAEAFQRVPVYDREGYIEAKTAAYRDIDNWEQDPNPINVFLGRENIGLMEGTYTDWQDLVSQTGNQQSYRLGFDGGSGRLGYNTSLTYFRERGVVQADDFERFNFQGNLDAELNDFISIGTSNVITYQKRDGRGPRFTDAVILSPIVAAYDSTGNYIFEPSAPNPRKSVLASLEDIEEERRLRLFSTVYAQLNLAKGLTFRTNLNGDVTTQRRGFMYPQKVPTEGFTVSGVDLDNNYGWLWNNILSYNLDAGIHRLSVTAAHEMQYDRSEFFGIDGQEQQFDQTLWYNLASNSNQLTESSLRETALMSFLARANYTFNDKYILSVSGRYDGASQLSDANKWDFFPAASAAWRVISEPFMADQNLFTDLKFRAGYGATGNASIAPYSTSASLNNNPLYYEFGEPGSESVAFGYRPLALAAAGLQWERTQQVNIGIDFGVLNNRLSGSVDVYRANTNRLLLQDQLPPTTGFDNVFVNAGKTESYGWEVYLRAFIVDTKNFDWTADISYFGSREEIVELASGQTADEGNLWFVGQPIDVHYDFNRLGIWQVEDADNPLFVEPGVIRVEDVDMNDTISFADRVVLGTPRPQWSGSLVSTFRIFDFDLTFNVYARMGQMIDAGAYAYDPRMLNNMLAVDYWTPLNPDGEYPRYDASRAELPYESTLRYRDGSFIKLRNVTLGYTLPQSVLDKSPLSNFRIYASGKNIAILHSELLDGLDPERNGSISWPLSRLWLVGLDASF